MTQQSNFQPNWASMPGDTITDIMNMKMISIEDLAVSMNYDSKVVKDLIFGKIQINDEFATALSKTLGASTAFWLNREKQFQSSIKLLRESAEKKWISCLPIKDMIRLSWINSEENIADNCLNFFDVPNVWSWNKAYSDVISLTSFRKSTAYDTNAASVISWLRFAEIKSREITCNKWNPKLFSQTLFEMRKLTQKKNPKDFIPILRSLCARCGVALVIQRTPDKCPASGATKVLSPDKAMILLSFRYLSDDQFWFTFFHEAGHLLLHKYKSTFVEGDTLYNQEEKEANDFSASILIPEKFQERLRTMPANKNEVIRLAKDADISLGIVVGQLQHLGRLNMKYLNGFKRRYLLQDIIDVSH